MPEKNGPFKHALKGEEKPQIPASLLRWNNNLTYCLTKEIAEGLI